MTRRTTRQLLCAPALEATAKPSWATKISMDAVTPSSGVDLMPQSMVPIWAKNSLDVELAIGQTLTN